jgi:hypothetical protein
MFVGQMQFLKIVNCSNLSHIIAKNVFRFGTTKGNEICFSK